MPTSDLRENLERLEDKILTACRAAGRTRGQVELMAVSKTHPSASLAEAVSLGLHLFGENRVQEFAAKSEQLAVTQQSGKSSTIRSQMQVHLIGHLQSNKAAKAIEVFDGIDSLDSLKLAERLNAAAGGSPLWADRRLPVLVEIKLSHEEAKAGLAPGSHELSDLLERFPDFKHLEARGLMTIAPFGVSEDETRACFRALSLLRDKLSQAYSNLNLQTLSMGMSGDFALAIAEGSTRIRVGTALFGARDYPQ